MAPVQARAPTTVAMATKVKAKPSKANKVSSAPSKNRWTGSSDGYDSAKWYGPDRKLFLPGGFLDPAEVPDYLDGTLAGDYGYDPLGLGKDGNVEKYREYELIHARWAMLGAFGALVPEIIDVNGGNIPGAVWWQTGSVQLADGSLTGPLNYLGNIPTLPLPVNLAVTVAAFFFLERFRTDGGEQAGIPAIFPNGPGADKLYPGGKFDPLGLASDPLAFEELKVKEIKNGRLAMVSMLAFAAQAATTHEGPVANLTAHLSGPFSNNLFTVLNNGSRAATL